MPSHAIAANSVKGRTTPNSTNRIARHVLATARFMTNLGVILATGPANGIGQFGGSHDVMR
jgi:hypothetical protein